MLKKRLDETLVTPRYEDAGLFKSDIYRLQVALLPGVQRNARNDYIFVGMINRKYQTPVLFAGRRASFAAGVVAITERIKGGTMGELADETVTTVAGRQALALRIDGAWRRFVSEDASGFALVRYQFIAAVWAFGARGDSGARFGLMPVR
ncbi:hypothetical protein ACJ5NV_04130 [Loktanella agnita]|uniref:hypothetical protein n=1 Tax=Loktanella agnita TaxID=287097 RepID=UPI003986BD88